MDFLFLLWPFRFPQQSSLLVVMQDIDSRLRVRRSALGGLRSTVEAGQPKAEIPQAKSFARRLASV